jgi:DNA-binding LytR/AlgR family response regulator
LKGYELDVSDYLLKPFSFERFVKSVNKVYNQRNIPFELQQKLTERKEEEKKFIFLKSGIKIEKIDINEITYIEGMKEYLGIHTQQSRTMILMSFHKLEEILPPKRFVRIHKSFSVALSKIQCIKNNHVCINDVQLPIGNTFRNAFYSMIECWKSDGGKF